MRALRILLVEDDFLIGMLLGEMLADAGHAVCATATTEDGAIAAAFRCEPDVMVVDLCLASGSGVGAVRAIRGICAIPHVYITGGARHDIPSDGPSLQKPFREEELMRAIRMAMTRSLPAASGAA